MTDNISTAIVAVALENEISTQASEAALEREQLAAFGIDAEALYATDINTLELYEEVARGNSGAVTTGIS